MSQKERKRKTDELEKKEKRETDQLEKEKREKEWSIKKETDTKLSYLQTGCQPNLKGSDFCTI